MIRAFINDCLTEAKEEYFKNDHHYYAGETGKDEDWKQIFDEDIFFEYVVPVIKDKCPDLYSLVVLNDLFIYCKEIVKGKDNAN